MSRTREANRESEALKQDMLRPEAYAPLLCPQGIAFVETHISWVFLLERDVFKVKKPVDLGFVDFRTQNQRRDACDAEVRLNRRLAPHVYLGVVPIRRAEDGHARIGGSGPVIEWAVHMLRLPDSQRASELLGAGKLGPSAIDDIARTLAAFHASCRTDADTASFGSLSVIERNVEENFAQTQDVLGKYLSTEQADEMVRWQRSFLRAKSSLFEKRAAQGRVRDGHGDLRLEHVYLEPQRITVLDCVEFSDRLRISDVCADIAFLSMDLTGHGRVDLAERLLATYARHANDFDLYRLVDFYESYRATVRAKIAAMVAESATAESVRQRRAAEEARRYFLLALSADRRSLLQPMLVAVGGTIASGKSTIAERIGAEMSAPVIDADRTRKAMLGVEPTHRLQDPAWTGAYDPKFTQEVYQEVLRRAEAVLASGRPVVVDASFRASSMRKAARDLAVRHGVTFRFVECVAPSDVCKARLAEREKHAGVSDGRLAIFDDFSKSFEPVRELAPEDHITLDTAQPLEHCLRALRAHVPTWPQALVG